MESIILSFFIFLVSIPFISIFFRYLFGLKLIGLTGGIASGKSTIIRSWLRLGISIIDFDIVSREIVKPGELCWDKIRKEFGSSIFNNDNTLNRKKLGELVFNNKERLNKLNSIMSYYIFIAFLNKLISHFFVRFNRVVVLDAPLLFETNYLAQLCTKTILVLSSPDTQLQRLMERDGLDQESALKRINSQMPTDKKRELADFIIENNGTIEELEYHANSWYVQNIKRDDNNWKPTIVSNILATIFALTCWIMYLLFSILI